MTEEVLIPELRFPEFEDVWNKKKLSDYITTLDSGVSVNSNDLPAKENEFGILKTSAAYGGTFRPDENKVIVKDEVQRARLNPKKDSILISRMNTPELVGELGYVDRDYPNLFVPDRLWMTSTNKHVDVKWLTYLLVTPKMRSRISSIGTGTSRSMKNISKPNFLGLGIISPQIGEQQKIASFLTAVDKRIQLLQEKKAQLERYKKGVMQKLFSQEIRFKDENGNDFPEWEEKRLGDVFTRKTTKNTNDQISNVLTNSAVRGIISQMDYFDHSVANKNNLSGYYIVEENDFVYNPRISSPAPVGPMNRNHNSLGVVSPLYTVLKFSKGDIDFFEYYFLSRQWHKYMKSIANYGARHDRMNVTTSDFMNMPIPFPTLAEQVKISKFIALIFSMIGAVNEQIKTSEKFKKGLLQKMFV